jgi:hypothetical protein
MQDVAIYLENRPGSLAEMGEALGQHGISIEGGGAWVVDGRGVDNYEKAQVVSTAWANE